MLSTADSLVQKLDLPKAVRFPLLNQMPPDLLSDGLKIEKTVC